MKTTILSFLLAAFICCAAYSNADARTLPHSALNEAAADSVLMVAEVMPEIIGGLQELYSNIRYPRQATIQGIEGRVIIQFIVTAEGRVENPTILRDIGGGCGEAAIEALRNVRFTPATQNGQPVSVYYSLPITFRLSR